jgi:hypothetical protein
MANQCSPCGLNSGTEESEHRGAQVSWQREELESPPEIAKKVTAMGPLADEADYYLP